MPKVIMKYPDTDVTRDIKNQLDGTTPATRDFKNAIIILFKSKGD